MIRAILRAVRLFMIGKLFLSMLLVAFQLPAPPMPHVDYLIDACLGLAFINAALIVDGYWRRQ